MDRNRQINPEYRNRGRGSGNAQRRRNTNDEGWRRPDGRQGQQENRWRDQNGNGNNRRNVEQGDRSGQQNNNRRENFGYNRNRNNGNQNYTGPRKMGYKMVQNLLENDDVEDVVLELSSDRRGFKDLLDDQNQKADMTVCTVKLLSKICDCPFQSAKTSLLNSVIDSSFVKIVTNFIATLITQNERDKRFNKHFWDDTDDFWHNIIKISKHLQDTIPSSSCESTLKLLKALKFNIPAVEDTHSIHVSDAIKSEINNLHDVIEKTAKEVERKKETHGYVTDYEDMEPPDDFREISVYPSAVEITTTLSPFLRPNVVKGPYQDVDHYLDVQFRLLREDFVLPLRNGICKYLENQRCKLDDIRIYHNVKFLNMEVVTDQNCFRIQYDFSNKKKSFQYENSKRFMFGSLLCFTHDKFANILFAKVVQRELKDLEKGQLIVGFSMDVVVPENIYDLEFLMVESKVYFEPYYQVLNVLKRMSTVNFPMEKYIIQVSTDTRPPDYLMKIDPVFMTIEEKRFSPLDWGDRKFYGLNEAQSVAFQAALTKECAIIQGPPGTGKTFLGLKIAETLLRNHKSWYESTPMLVICFTNHALDQFLEGLIPITDELIRVGGQSKNDKMKEYNLRQRGRRMREATVQKKIEVRNCISEIAHINEILNEIEKYSGVFDFNEFSKIVPNFANSWFQSAQKEQIVDWLLGTGHNPNMFRRDDAARLADPEILDQMMGEDLLDMKREELVDEIFEDIRVKTPDFLISLKDLSSKIWHLKKDINEFDSTGMDQWTIQNCMDGLYFELNMTERLQEHLGYCLQMGAQIKGNIVAPEFTDLSNPYRMAPDDRWQLYFYWLSLYETGLRNKKENISVGFRDKYSVYTEMQEMEDTEAMKGALVVGMTTTGAARLQSSLQALKSPIVIVEEAAEVLEAHIVAALTPHCKHLILIGDHQQLKPSTSNFKIETKYLLGVSLFERMVANQIQCHTLNVQHRMRPEIANLVRPSIYPILHDHESVFDRPDIKGVENNLFFIDHREKEETIGDNSKKNVHEARFLIQFAKHLILNGYKPEDITILAAYLGQMFEMQRERKADSCSLLLQDVRIAVLDNYQGEESNIVLLSLVRSNDDNKIGFLKTENRVCVALSRARNGFYIMGNLKQLCDNSEIWHKIRETLENQKAVGPHLTLRCQIHRHRITNVKTASDFLKISEGGCDLLCEEGLKCGHVCKRLCHIDDREHDRYDCQEKCEKILCDNQDHVCRKLCYQECGLCCYPVERQLKCGHSVKMECHLDPDKFECTVQIDAVLPCGHETKKPCGMDPDKFACPFPCNIRVEPCGHACLKNCHIKYDPDHLKYDCKKPCERTLKGCTNVDEPHACQKLCFEECSTCNVKTKKKLAECDHWYDVACSADTDDIICRKPCKKIQPCGHKCKKTCAEPCGNCQFEVKKVVPDCNHTVEMECWEPPHRDYCKGTCPRLLKCGHVCGKRCFEECRTRCKEIVDCHIPSPCGHVIKKISCYYKNNYDDKYLLENCSEKCNVELKCKHTCSGTCGECFQGRFHKRCMEKCGVPLVCNHECQIPCREACKPCTKPCEYWCKHSRCGKKCGDPCTGCKEKCSRSCQHQKCKNRCGQICSVPPCTKPCTKKLKCSHDCVGFCGDPCPKLCRICDEDELTEIYFGTEDDPDARFVSLKDCGHIIESTAMERWLQNDPDEIKPKDCPKCKTVIKKTARYSDYVIRNMEDLMKVKRKFYGNPKEIKNLIVTIKTQLNMLLGLSGNTLLSLFIRKLIQRLESANKGRRQDTSKMDLDALKTKVDLINMISDYMKEYSSLAHYPSIDKHLNLIVLHLSKYIDSTSQQETDDIVLEIDRLQRWLQFEKMLNDRLYNRSTVMAQEGKIRTLLESPTRYDKNKDAEIKEQLDVLNKMLSAKIDLTEKEKKEIVAAVGLTRGHWYKCPNGHPYAIGECGGAMQVSKCYECGAAIGGRNHALLSGNAVAREMDGATHAAWSEQANMDNYIL